MSPLAVTPKKSLGQHFLHDKRILARIADAAGLDKGKGVLEIGPGLGALTQELARRAGKVVAIEIDGRVIPELERMFADQPHVTIIQGDAMKLDWVRLAREAFSDQPFALCANLPYYITSPLIMGALEGGAPVSPVVVLVQREVAQRMAAKPGSPDYGLLSVAAQRYAKVETLFRVPPGCFTPPPKVDSAVVRLVRRPDAPGREETAAFFTVARAAFAMRRKTLENNLMAGLSLPREAVSAAIHQAGIAPGVRAETLSGQQFEALASVFFPSGGCLSAPGPWHRKQEERG
nr:16S rRNA (adenine(1518)-N(6)/adenine(1519)-N(6))-dimethyltransferase RsmA [bacterium]